MKIECPGAPERVEIALLDAFRRHHRVRRLRRAAGVIAIASVASLMLFVRIPEQASPPKSIAAYPAPPAMAWMRTKSRPRQPESRVRKPAVKPPTDRVAMTDFVPLPYGDYSMVEESATIVRVELPRSALRLAGFNVAEERANDRVQADVVLGADGLAHAVRFVKYQQ